MDQRYSDRIPVACSAMISGDGVSGEGRVMDVSLPGCLIESPGVVRVGDYIRLKLFLPDHRSPIDIPLAVVRRVEGAHIGVEFIRSSSDDQIRLTYFVKRRAKLKKTVRWEQGIEMVAVSGE
jgi:hypothetical protein